MWRVFLAASSPKVNVFFLLSAILYFNHICLLSLLPPLRGGIDVCTRELFYTKFNSEQLLFEDFFDVTRIFDSVESYIECILEFQEAFLIMLSHSGLQWRHIAVRLTEWPNLVNCTNLGQNLRIFLILFIFLVLCFKKICWFQS